MGGEKFSVGEQLRMKGLTQMLPRRVKRAVCPFLFLFPLSLSSPPPPPHPTLHTYPVPGTRCFVSLKVQPGNTARAKRTGHSFSYFSFLPFPPRSCLSPVLFSSLLSLHLLKYLLITYYVPGFVPGAGDTTVSESDMVPALLSVRS